MGKAIKIFICCMWAGLLFCTALQASNGESGWYNAEIVYQEAVSKILKRGDISWGDNPDDDYKFHSVLVSADGSTVLFTGKCEWCSPAEVRPFLVNPDGSNLRDISNMFPSDITNRWSAWKNMQINDDGSRVFFRAVVEAGYYDDEYLYVYDVSSSQTELAIAMDEGFSPFGYGWRFRIDAYGNTVYMDTYDAGWSDTLEKRRKGLFHAVTGGERQWYFDVDDLPCDSQCGNLNLFDLMGVSKQNSRAFFQWNSDYSKTDGSNQHTGFYYTDLSGTPVRLSDEYYWIDEGDPRGICDTEGNTAIYRYISAYGEPSKLAVVDVASKSSRDVAWTDGLNGFDAHLSRSGRYVLVNGEYGEDGIYYHTLIDLENNTSRDTWSYHMLNRWGSTSNLTADDRYYFYSKDDTSENSGLYRIDTQTDGDDIAPYVHAIQFSRPALLDQDDFTISVQAEISAPNGLENIDWVILRPLINGQEDPEYPMGRVPLAYPSGDPSSTRLYDDGTHGDAVAGDGIFTFDEIATRKGGRDETEWNTWYYHNTLPAPLGIRVIVRDSSFNYAVADTTLLITDNPDDVQGTPDDPEDPSDPGTSGGTCAVIGSDLSLSVPCAVYSNPLVGSLIFSLDFLYLGVGEDGLYLWQLAGGEEISGDVIADEQACSQVSAGLDQLIIPCARLSPPFETSAWQLTFGILPVNENNELIMFLEQVVEAAAP